MEYYSARKKRDETLTCLTTWMNLKNIIPNERSKENSKKPKDDTLHDFIHIKYYRKSKTILTNEWLLGGRPEQSIDFKEMGENLLG